MATTIAHILQRQRHTIRDALFIAAAMLVAGLLAYQYSFGSSMSEEQRIDLAELVVLGALLLAGILFFGWRRIVEQERQHEQLELALDNMSHGLAMFDADQRLQICNRLYAEMYGLTIEQVKPGMSAREVLEQRVVNKCYRPSDAQDILNRLQTDIGPSDTQLHRLADGRFINVSHKRAASGSLVVMHQDVTDQQRAQAKIVHMALHDTLTGLPNRAFLKQRLDEALAGVARGELLAIHIVDLDNFKPVNDTLGHPAGDLLLRASTDRLRGLIRNSDTLARVGGDEFVVLQYGIGQRAEASTLAQRIVDTLAAPFTLEGKRVVAGASVGVAMAPANGTTPDQLMRNADLALYRSKAAGRSTFRFFDPETDLPSDLPREAGNGARVAVPAPGAR